MIRWDYAVIYLNHFDLSKNTNSLVIAFDELGKAGWELVSVHDGLAYFKRSHSYLGIYDLDKLDELSRQKKKFDWKREGNRWNE